MKKKFLKIKDYTIRFITNKVFHSIAIIYLLVMHFTASNKHYHWEYAYDGHNHNGDHSRRGHTHNYAEEDHNHNYGFNAYAKEDHTHSIDDIIDNWQRLDSKLWDLEHDIRFLKNELSEHKTWGH